MLFVSDVISCGLIALRFTYYSRSSTTLYPRTLIPHKH